MNLATRSSITEWRHVGDGLVDRLVAHQIEPRSKMTCALVVHHVVVFQQVLADVEVARLDLLLRLFQRLVDPGMNDGLVLLETQLLRACRRACRSRRCVIRSSSSDRKNLEWPGRPGGRNGRATGCRCAALVPFGAEAHRGRPAASAFSFSRATCLRISSARGLFFSRSRGPISVISWRMPACRRCRRAECRCRGRPC